MDENSKAIVKMRSNNEFNNNPLGSNIPKEYNTSNRAQGEKIVHDLNDLKCKYESKLNSDKVIENIFLNIKNSKEIISKDDYTSENNKIKIPKEYSDNNEKSYIALLICICIYIYEYIYIYMSISIFNYSNKKKNKRNIINNNNLKFLGNKVLMIQLLLYPLLINDYKLIKFVNAANSKIIVKSINKYR